MRRMYLHHDDDYEEEAAKLEGTPPTRSHVSRTINTDTVVIAPDGSIPAIFLRQRIPLALQKAACRDWRTVKGLPESRPSAVGAPSRPEFTKDGKLSAYQSVPKLALEVLKKRGVRTGTIRRKGRHTPLIKLLNKLYKQNAPSIYPEQRAVAKKIRHIRGTAFSVGYLSKNWQTAYHRDGNLLGGMTCLIAMGDFKHGELVLARWRIAFALQPGDLLIFNAEELHGNLPFQGERVSAAFYCERPSGY